MGSAITGSGAECPAIASRQSGVFTRQQAWDAGWSARQVERRIAAGRWRVLAGKGLVVSGSTATPDAFAWAAQLTWPGSVVSHRTAAGLYGWPVDAGDRAHVTSNSRRSHVRGIVVHRRSLDEWDWTLSGQGIPVTTPIRTALDCLAEFEPEQGASLWAWLSTRRVINRSQLAAAARHRFGCHGTPQLIEILERTRDGAASEAERQVHRLLRRAGLVGWRANVTVIDSSGRRFVVDILFPKERVIIEVDGWVVHGTREAFFADSHRQSRLMAAGYVVFRVTWDDLVNRPDELIANLRAVLKGRGR